MSMFCPKCGSILMPKKGGLRCACGYKQEGKMTLTEEKRSKETIGTEVIEDKENLPLVEADCDKCGHKKAYYWTKQTRAGDEPETRFFKCEKCSHTWREYK